MPPLQLQNHMANGINTWMSARVVVMFAIYHSY